MIRIFGNFLEENGVIFCVILIILTTIYVVVRMETMSAKVNETNKHIGEIYERWDLPVNNTSDVEWHKELDRMYDIVQKYEKEHGKGNKK